MLRTPSGQPFYLNLHSSPEGEDSADKKLPGNTIIIGSTGVGKTTLEMFLLTLTRKWNPAPRLVLFDLDRGCEIAIRALNGRYFTLEAGKPTHLNPLQRDPTPARIQFWEQLIRICIATPALPLLPADERAIGRWHQEGGGAAAPVGGFGFAMPSRQAGLRWRWLEDAGERFGSGRVHRSFRTSHDLQALDLRG